MYTYIYIHIYSYMYLYYMSFTCTQSVTIHRLEFPDPTLALRFGTHDAGGVAARRARRDGAGPALFTPCAATAVTHGTRVTLVVLPCYTPVPLPLSLVVLCCPLAPHYRRQRLRQQGRTRPANRSCLVIPVRMAYRRDC